MFPSETSPISGIFIKEQLKEIKKLCSVSAVISPVPWLYSRKGKRKEEEWEGIKVYRPGFFMLPKLTIYLNGFFYFISVYLFLRRMKGLINFDLVHVHFAYPAGFAGALLGKILKKRIILTVRGTDINYFTENTILRILIKYSLNNVDGIIAVSESLKKKVVSLGIGENKISVIPNGVDLSHFKPIPKEIARKQVGLSNNDKIILYVGAFEEVKGLSYLVSAFKQVCNDADKIGPNDINNLKLVLIGEGSLYNKIYNMILDYGIEKSVLLKKYISHKEIPLWMNSCDVLCLTSLNEGRPNVLYEAVACGVPVVATNVGGVSEIIISNELGELVLPKSVNDIKDALIRVLKKEWDPQSIRNYALPHSMSSYSERVVDVYRKCLNMHGN